MVLERNGDLLEQEDIGIICNLVDCHGVGVGMTKKIWSKYPEAYGMYKAYCKDFWGRILLGTTQFVRCADGKFVANLFAQSDDPDPDYEALDRCIMAVAAQAEFSRKYKVGFIRDFGCELGGNWDPVKEIIFRHFTKTAVPCIICSP